METNIFLKGLGHWPDIFPIGPLGKTFGNVLEPVCPKPPQIMVPMEPTFSRRVLDPGLEFSKLGPLVKTLAMFWDLCVQSHLK